LAYKKELTGINSFLIGNSKADKMNKIYQLFCNNAGIKKPKNIPKCLVYPIGFLLELIYTLFRFKKSPILTRGRVNMFYDNVEYSIKKANKKLKFKNKFGLNEAIKNTVDWYKKNNFID